MLNKKHIKIVLAFLINAEFLFVKAYDKCSRTEWEVSKSLNHLDLIILPQFWCQVACIDV